MDNLVSGRDEVRPWATERGSRDEDGGFEKNNNEMLKADGDAMPGLVDAIVSQEPAEHADVNATEREPFPLRRSISRILCAIVTLAYSPSQISMVKANPPPTRHQKKSPCRLIRSWPPTSCHQSISCLAG